MWRTKIARDVAVGDRIVRNVVRGLEWVSGPYGAFIIVSIAVNGDEFVLTGRPVWGGKEEVRLILDGDEEVTVY